MLSRMLAFARPVRGVCASLRKSSTAFSMRVLPAANASFVDPGVLIAFLVCESLMEIGNDAALPKNAATAHLCRRNCRAYAFTQHDSFDVARLIHVEAHDGHAVVHTQRDRRRIHNLQVLMQDIAIADLREK